MCDLHNLFPTNKPKRVLPSLPLLVTLVFCAGLLLLHGQKCPLAPLIQHERSAGSHTWLSWMKLPGSSLCPPDGGGGSSAGLVLSMEGRIRRLPPQKYQTCNVHIYRLETISFAFVQTTLSFILVDSFQINNPTNM